MYFITYRCLYPDQSFMKFLLNAFIVTVNVIRFKGGVWVAMPDIKQYFTESITDDLRRTCLHTTQSHSQTHTGQSMWDFKTIMGLPLHSQESNNKQGYYLCKLLGPCKLWINMSMCY